MRLSEFNELDLRRKTKICHAPSIIVFGNPAKKNSIEIRLFLAKRVPRKTRVKSQNIYHFTVRSYTLVRKTIKTDVNDFSICFQPSDYLSENCRPQ